jgi:dihydroorotase
VTPHHLLLTEELVRSYNPIYKVNPPLRTKEDTLALRSALLDGTIDILATDHAPHSKEKKECDWPSAAFGMVGLEAAASVLYQVLIVEGGRSWSDFAQITSSRPAEIGGLKGFGEIAVGKRANLCLFDPSSKRVAKAQTQSLSVNNPWQSRELLGEVERTIYRGKVTYTRSSA